jgi:hypothetical protein
MQTMNTDLGRRVFLRAVDLSKDGTPRAFAPISLPHGRPRHHERRRRRRREDRESSAPGGWRLGASMAALIIAVAALFTAFSCVAFLVVHGAPR